MIMSTYIIHDGAGTTPYYSPSISRGGLAALFSIDVTHQGGTPSMSVAVEHKNRDDVTWGVAGSFPAVSAVGVQTLNQSGLKEQIRFAFTFSSGNQGDFFAVMVPAPAWRPQ